MFVPKIDDEVPARHLALADIDRIVSEELGPARVVGNAQPAAFNRQVSMYLAHRFGGWSVTKIGKFYNGRHHTTVCHAVRRIEARRERNANVDGLLTALIDRIKSARACAPGRREHSTRRIPVTESTLPITEELLTILADRLASHLKVKIDEIFAMRMLDASSGRG
jgi:hypothetical protein